MEWGKVYFETQKIAGVIILCALFCFSCKKDEELKAFEGTKWKLTALVDPKTGELIKDPEPKDCAMCYTLTFDTDSTFSTFSGVYKPDDLSWMYDGKYAVDFNKKIFQITRFGGYKGSAHNLYIDIFWSYTIHSFSYSDKNLKLFYIDNKHYLLFKHF